MLGTDAGFYEIGGTSLASPFVAGELALWNQVRHADGRPAIGFANPLLYRSAAILSDVRNVKGKAQIDGTTTHFEADVINDPTANSVHATRGWDPETGMGVITGKTIARG
jgi:tripeptidyl-peptidase-1